MKTIRSQGPFIGFAWKQKIFLQKVYGTLESNKPLDDLRDTLRENFKITYILEGLSLKLWWVRSVRGKPYEMDLTPQGFTLVPHEIFVVRLWSELYCLEN